MIVPGGRGSPMTDGQEDVAVTIGEEICCLLAAGWTWDGDKLVKVSSGSVQAASRQDLPELVERAGG
jgi:hypothetical protein